jgi:hypothetical protein
MAIHKLCLFVSGLSVAAALLLPGCTKESQAGLNLVVSTIGVQGSPLGKVRLAADTAFTHSGQRFTFTPTSIKVNLYSIQIFDEWTRNNDGELIGGGENSKEIGIPIDRTVDLVSSGTIADLVDEQIPIEEDKFGTYIGAKLLMSDTVTLSGTVSVKDTTYQLENVKIRFGVAGGHIVFSKPLVVDDTAISPTVRIIFDMESIACLAFSDHPATDPYVTGLWEVKLNETTSLGVNYPVIIPFVGSGSPRIEKYLLTVANDSTYAIKIVLMADADNAVIDAKILPIYKTGFSDSAYNANAIEPAGWTTPLIAPTASGISIGINEEFSSGAENRFVSFTDFQRQDHSGTLSVGSPVTSTKPYSAVLYETISE